MHLLYLHLVEGGQTWRKIDRSGHLRVRGRPLPSSGKETAEDDNDDDDDGDRAALKLDQ